MHAAAPGMLEMLLGGYLMLAALPLVFHLARRQDPAPLLCGLLGVAQALHLALAGGTLLQPLPPPGAPLAGAALAAWFGTLTLYVLLVDRLFPKQLPRRAPRVLAGACGLGAATALLGPASALAALATAGAGLATAGALILGWALARARHWSGARVLLAGLLVLGAVALARELVPAGPLLEGATALGLLLFALSPSIVLLRRTAQAFELAELRGAQEREKVDLLVRTTQAGIIDWDGASNEVNFSPRLLEILGWPPGMHQARQPSYFEWIHPADRAMIHQLFLQQLRERSVRSGELRHEPRQYRLLRRDGKPIWIHAEAISLRDAKGRAVRYICSVLDITEHRAAAERLAQQNAALAENARLREDVERMSRHDLKTPLNSILGVTRLLREDAQLQPEHRELLAISERAGLRLLEMVNLSLDLSRMERGTYAFRPQAVNLVDVVSRVMLDLRSLADSARVHVRLEQAFARPLYARAEELLCYSILANLLKNAIEATPAGGNVRVGMAAGEPVRLWVRNPGQVPPTVAEHFFDKYFTAGKRDGTGLGTYSARLMARVQEGELRLDSGAGGTTVTLTLRALGAEQLPSPRSQAAPALAAPAAVLAAYFRPQRVLVVDDDDYNRLLLLRYLPSPPFTVESAADGRAATEAVARQWPDLVLVDMEMPVMNGLEAVAWIRQREARDGREPCRIVMLSSNDDPLSIRRGLAAGSDRYLVKPFTREALLALLQELDGGSGPVQVPLELEDPPAAEPASPALPHAPVHVDGELRAEVPAFLASRRRLVEAMQAALATGEREELRAVAHRAAGGLALFGFQWAAWQSRRISLRAAGGEPDALAQEIARLREHLETVQVH